MQVLLLEFFLICSTGCTYQTDFIAAKAQLVDGTYTTKDITETFPIGTPITTYIQTAEK